MQKINLTGHTPPPLEPDPQFVRGECPVCGESVVSNVYYVGGKGYVSVWECWGSLQANAGRPNTCNYRRVL